MKTPFSISAISMSWSHQTLDYCIRSLQEISKINYQNISITFYNVYGKKVFDTILKVTLKSFFFISEIVNGLEVQHRYACDSPNFCHTNRYSIECPVSERIAMIGIKYGAKPYTYTCPKSSETCVSSRLCCHHESEDCLVPFSDLELMHTYNQCSNRPQCGWFFAKSVELPDNCRIRDRTNYVWAEYQCVHG